MKMSPLPGWVRFYFYGMHGFFDEIIFTSIFDHVASDGNNWSLKGHSSIYSFFIYGSCCFAVEYLYRIFIKRGIPLLSRLFVYLIICYAWELCSGLILRQFNACPWDYSHYPLNFMGLITLEYAPGWLFLSLWQDVMFGYFLRLRFHGDGDFQFIESNNSNDVKNGKKVK
ncbi:unnamed protein product [Owenia fusiformis]|uniref:Transmembrane protein 229B n=1 Tax=Owenia fusiformis TaxID=6347 RepID=A0A8S4NZ43_OWEFU|nr:unnamed protein product [Owenia fusiformis]